ncbi:MAG TPA: CDP-6-deoxy-delta-3,4-glucoseen reductase [Roseateles sp.]|nr:CDP-6-deoxy-delta-3,4-glucoseen reductase [Roseateles sp.]HWT53625.1 CDP-6-deoxy-delta-3,4-glucoseen reductase [Rhodocyclaceae bacterium]
MTHQITLKPSGHTYAVADDQILLEAALDAGYVLPYGCRNGACGSCRAKVLAGSVDHGRSQKGALPDNARSEGYTLLCCATAQSDVVIECRELADSSEYPVKIMPCRVQELTRLADDVMLLKLKLPVNERLAFRAGQYIEFMLKGGGRRAFSLANPPHDDEFLEVHIRKIDGGKFTGHVFDAMQVKEILRFEGPHGTFHLREESVKPIILLAGGTGFAPIKSIVEHMIHNQIRRPIRLYWGARNRAGLYLHSLAEQWAAEHAHIEYIPVLSDAGPDDVWNGRSGLVHVAVMDDLADLSAHQVYACGSPGMIEAARKDFTARGLPEDEFFADAFTFAA